METNIDDCTGELLGYTQELLFNNRALRETTTIGIRYRHEYRTVLKREMIEFDTKYGKIKAKKVINDGETYIYPEYENIK